MLNTQTSNLKKEALNNLVDYFESKNMTDEINQARLMLELNGANQRRHIRHVVDKAAWFEFGGQSAVFTARDLSEGGAFIQPEYSYLDGEYIKPNDYSNLFFEGDIFEFVIVDGLDEYHHTARIKWYGYHTKHDCEGFGIEFVGGGERVEVNGL